MKIERNLCLSVSLRLQNRGERDPNGVVIASLRAFDCAASDDVHPFGENMVGGARVEAIFTHCGASSSGSACQPNFIKLLNHALDAPIGNSIKIATDNDIG